MSTAPISSSLPAKSPIQALQPEAGIRQGRGHEVQKMAIAAAETQTQASPPKTHTNTRGEVTGRHLNVQA